MKNETFITSYNRFILRNYKLKMDIRVGFIICNKYILEVFKCNEGAHMVSYTYIKEYIITLVFCKLLSTQSELPRRLLWNQTSDVDRVSTLITSH